MYCDTWKRGFQPVAELLRTSLMDLPRVELLCALSTYCGVALRRVELPCVLSTYGGAALQFDMIPRMTMASCAEPAARPLCIADSATGGVADVVTRVGRDIGI